MSTLGRPELRQETLHIENMLEGTSDMPMRIVNLKGGSGPAPAPSGGASAVSYTHLTLPTRSTV